MTTFLVRRFVKNYEQTDQIQVRTAYGVLSSVVGIFCNMVLFAVKLTVGLLMHSIAVMADGFNNLSDAASSVIGFIGVKMAEKPADRQHPFGHGRMEYITALIVAFLVIEVGLDFLKTSLKKLGNPEMIRFDLIPFLILVLSIGVKLWLAAFNRTLGKRLDSKVMLATAADSMGDVVTTGATLVSILICTFTQMNVDAIAGLLVSLAVIWAGIQIAKDTLEPLIGQGADPLLAEQISQEVERYDGIAGTHDLIVHNYGPGRSMASIHAEIPRDMDIEAAHGLIDRIERQTSKKLGIFLVIHMDPVEVRDQRVLDMKEKIGGMIDQLEPAAAFHDFHMSWTEQGIHLTFEVRVPYSYTKEKEEELRQEIVGRLLKENPCFQCDITVEQGYVE